MIDARNGPSDGASAVERRLMPIPGVFYGGGCCYMACRGLMLGGISDVLLISHGPIGCAYYAGISGCEGPGLGVGANAKEGADATAASVEVPAFAARTFVTCMDESDIVFGGEEKLANAIDEAVARYHPEAIAVCATCPVGIIGDDIEQVARDAAIRHGIDVLALSCEGFKREPGWLIGGRRIFEEWVGRETRPRGPYPIHYMSESARFGNGVASSLLEQVGYDVVCSLMGATTYEDIRASQDARLIVLDSGKAIDAVPQMYGERYGTGFMRVSFTGLGNIARSLRAMARSFGSEELDLKTEQVISASMERIAPALERARERYARRIAVIFEDIFRSDAFATMALELGMDVIMIAPDYAAQHYTDQGFCMNVPVALAGRIACSGFPSGERRASLPGCEHALRPVSARDADWVRATFSSREVTDALSILNPDICFAGVEQRFGRIRTPMRSEKFLSDERGTDYGGFEGFVSFARDLAIASELGHWLDTEPSWLTEGRQDG